MIDKDDFEDFLIMNGKLLNNDKTENIEYNKSYKSAQFTLIRIILTLVIWLVLLKSC